MKTMYYHIIKYILLLLINIIYADGSVYYTHFQEMLSNQTSHTSTLHKDKETEDRIYYQGTIALSGVLEWQMYQDEVDFYWRLVFFPDAPSVLPRLFANDNQAIFLNDTLKKNAESQKSSFLQIYNILQNKLSQADEYILGGIAMRATLTLKDYYINKYLENEADTRYYATIYKNLTILSDIRKWYINKKSLPGEYILSYASKDPFINLRESPNGKILTQIQKTDMLESCQFQDDKGLLLHLGEDSTNPQWLKVAYITPEAKDTSKAIYGVIHESQVSWECGKN